VATRIEPIDLDMACESFILSWCHQRSDSISRRVLFPRLFIDIVKVCVYPLEDFDIGVL
jgi:hypothetical protein